MPKAKTTKPAAKASAKPSSKVKKEAVKAPAKKVAKAEKQETPKAEKKVAPKKEAIPVTTAIDTEAGSTPEVDVVAAPAKKVKAKKAKSAKQLASEKAVADETKKWGDLKEKYGAEKANTYAMSGVYESNKPLQHKVLGWGYIVSVQNDRLEVLFEQGTKMLISNYKTK